MHHISADQIIKNLNKAALYYQEIIKQLVEHYDSMEVPINFYDSDKSHEIATQIFEQLITHPEKFTAINLEYVNNLQKLIAESVNEFTGKKLVNKKTEKDFPDKRFDDPVWGESIYFDFIRKYYTLSSKWMKDTIQQYEVDSDGKRLLEFTANQFIDALSPANFIFSNPEVLKESLETGMQNIAQGMKNFLKDIKKSTDMLNISTTDKSYFHLGKNIASTKGKVIFQNDLMQLICYEPTEKTYKVPLFIIPPWINKYYILDLSEHNSLIKWLVDNNFQLFLVSWVNPKKKLANKKFEDYLEEGILQPLEYIKKLGFNKVNSLGYCIGGTLLAIALSYLKSKKNNIINSATFLTTLVDFANPGEIGALINKFTINYIEKKVLETGYLDGKYLANSFSLIRANDLVWSYFVNNYLLGKSPAAFDILYWNSDATNLPANMYIYYLKNMYLDNLLKKPNALEMLGTKIDLSIIDTPSFWLAAKTDHIALWKSVYNGAKIFKGERTFCLTDAGHVAGVVNPPNNQKYSHKIGDIIVNSSRTWQADANKIKGSWWMSYLSWLKKYSGNLEKSIKYGNLKMLEEAPGSYVKR